jgi:hypothetical protein
MRGTLVLVPGTGGCRFCSRRTGTSGSSILLADQIAVGVTVAAVVVGTVSAVSGGTGCCGSYCCCPDRRSAIRIPSTISSAAIGRSTVSGPAIGHATPRNGAASDTYRANPAGTDTASTVSEGVIGYKGRANKDGGCETYESITQHGNSPFCHSPLGSSSPPICSSLSL